MASSHIETWRIKPRNMSMQFAHVYGSEISPDRLKAAGEIRLLHARGPSKYALAFTRIAWGAPNHRRVPEIKEASDSLRLRAKVDGPPYDPLKSIGITMGPGTGRRFPIARKPSM